MEPIARETFRRQLRELTATEFAAFVAALWSARGATTRVEGQVVYVEGRERKRIRTVCGRQVAPGDTPGDGDDDGSESVDVVAFSGRADPPWRRPLTGRVWGASSRNERDGVEHLDADDLREMLLYAVPRPAATDICRRFFDRPLLEPGMSDATESGVVGGGVGRHSATVVVAVLGVVLLVAGLVGAPVLTPDGEGVFGAPDSVGDADEATTPVGSSLTATPDERRQSVSGPDGPYPPGVGPEGITDANRLADAHAKAATGQSYRVTLTHREFVGDDASAYRRETVYVESPTTYLTVLEGAGVLNRPDQVISGMEAYADGEVRYERRLVDDEFEPTYTYRSRTVAGVRNGEGRYADRVETYLTWFLSVEESTVVDTFEVGDTRYYWLRLGDDPYPGIENASGSVLVDDSGFVHEVQRGYDIPREPGVSVVVTIRYTDVGVTAVDPPEWLSETTAGGRGEDSENATATGQTATATEQTATATEASKLSS